MPELIVEGLANVRDLGGRERVGGGLTPRGVFFRSEQLDRVTDRGGRTLHDLGVATVIDLRRPDERTGSVPDGLTHVEVDLDGVDPAFWDPIEADGRFGTPLYYTDHLARLPDRMREVLDAVAKAPTGGVLFHCGAGWDRTGFVAALLLRAADATPEAAAADYERSFISADAMEALHEQPFHAELRREVLARYGHTPVSSIQAAYAALDLEAWFDHASVSEMTRVAVRTWRGALAP